MCCSFVYIMTYTGFYKVIVLTKSVQCQFIVHKRSVNRLWGLVKVCPLFIFHLQYVLYVYCSIDASVNDQLQRGIGNTMDCS
jgi:hypothetical protein